MKTLNKKIIKNISKLLLVLFSFTMIGANGMTSASAAGATVSYKLSNTTVKVGDTVTIDVNVANASDLYGASFDFTYDKTLLQVTGITDGNLFSNTPVNNYLTQGKIEFAATNTGSKASITGGKVLTITAKALKTGTVDFSKATVKLSNSSAAAINSTVSTTGAALTITNGTDVEYSKLLSFTANPTQGIVGQTVTFTAQSDKNANSVFEFYIKKEGRDWAKGAYWGPSNTLTWKPTSAGNYTIRVRVKNNNSNKTSDDYKDMAYKVTNGPVEHLTSVALKSSVTTGKVGQTITFTATPTPNTKDAEFEFYIKKADGEWAKGAKWGSSNTLTWKPGSANTYTIRVRARHINTDKTSDCYKDIKLTVTK